MTFDSPILALLTLPLVLWLAWITRRYRGCAKSSLRLAGVLLSLAVCGVRLECERSPKIAVMIDVSPSTRGALVRNRSAVEQRIAPLLNGRSATIHYFGDGLQIDGNEQRIGHTRLEVPEADCIVLLSDGRFEASVSLPPVFAVVDPTMDLPDDGRIDDLTLGNDSRIQTTVSGRPRKLSLTGASPAEIGVGGEQTHLFQTTSNRIVAALNSGDLWPENDFMQALRQPGASEIWSVDLPLPSAKTVRATELPRNIDGYIGVSEVVLPTTAGIDAAQSAALLDYVREIGGSLVLQGPPAAAPAALRAMAPLTADPPTPQSDWILLLDASGSMADAGRWPAAIAAAKRAVELVGPDESVTIMTFARESRVIIDHATPTAAAAALRTLTSVSPNGPTGLQAALGDALTKSKGPTRLLLLTDGDAELSDRTLWAERFQKGRVTLFAILTQNTPLVAELARETGGAATVSATPSQWANDMERIAAAGLSKKFDASDSILSQDLLEGLNFSPIPHWQAWPRPAARTLATAGQNVVAAIGQQGLGQVTSWSADLPSPVASAVLPRLIGAADDSNFTIAIDEAKGRVAVSAVSPAGPMNDLQIVARLSGQAQTLRQTSPGQYEIDLRSNLEPRVAVFTLNGRIIARRSISARYPAEYNAVGNDREALQDLTRRTGGKMIETNDHDPLPIRGRHELRSLASPLAAAGGLATLLGLLFLRLPYLEDRLRLRWRQVTRALTSSAQSRTAH